MGIVLSLLYFVTYYLTPATVFGALAQFRVELILAGLILTVSIPSFAKSFLFKTPQILALVGLALSVIMSFIAIGWGINAGIQAFLGFIPNALAYILVCLHFNTKFRLKFLVFIMLFVCLFVIAHGYYELRHPLQEDAPSNLSPGSDPAQQASLDDNSYQMPGARVDGVITFYRMRGLGEIHDPNDFAQFTVSVLPLVFIFWKAKKTVRNIFLVLLPVSILIYGVFLTHSRGALLALIGMAIVSARRRIGTIPSLLLAGVMFVAAMALNFTGGREISAEQGADRTSLWSQGLQIFRSHPLFGVGFNRMGDFTDAHLTAHNSLVVTAVEIGFVGLVFWCVFLYTSLRDVLAVVSAKNVLEQGTPHVAELLSRDEPSQLKAIEEDEINHLARVVVLSFTGFLITAWFLSRSFVLTFFLIGGIAEVAFQLALKRGMISPRVPLPRILRSSVTLAIGLILAMYVLIRAVNLSH